jgi:O-antigen ligase
MLNNKLTPPLSIFAFFLFFSYIIPFHFHPYRSYYNDAAAIISVILALSWIGFQARAVLRIPSAIILPLLIMVIIGLQTLNGMLVYPIDSVFPILYLISFVIAITFGATLAVHPDGLNKLGVTLACVFVAAGLISVIAQWVQLINLNWYPYVMPLAHDRNPRPFGNLGQPNLLALLMCFSIASCWYLYVTRQIKANLALSFIVLLLIGSALTQSRTCWVILPLLVVLCWHQPRDCPKVFKPVLIILLLLFIALVMYTPDLLKYFGIVLDSVEERAGNTSVRLILWEQAWTISLLHPWFGAGWFQFGPQQAMLSSLFPPTEYSDYAHNIVLNFAAEMGCLSLFLFFWLLYIGYTTVVCVVGIVCRYVL